MNNSHIIKVYEQDLCSNWINKNGYYVPKEYIDAKQLIKNLEENGLKVLKFTYSLFSNCYFIEVIGEYNGNIEMQKLHTHVSEFEWNV